MRLSWDSQILVSHFICTLSKKLSRIFFCRKFSFDGFSVVFLSRGVGISLEISVQLVKIWVFFACFLTRFCDCVGIWFQRFERLVPGGCILLYSQANLGKFLAKFCALLAIGSCHVHIQSLVDEYGGLCCIRRDFESTWGSFLAIRRLVYGKIWILSLNCKSTVSSTCQSRQKLILEWDFLMLFVHFVGKVG